ncbi:MAG: hypothetical protein V1847_02235 [Candidatus Diapherotrites archaeon]
MPNTLAHRVCAVLFLLAFLHLQHALNPFNAIAAIAIAILFGGGTLNASWKKFGISPDIDLLFWHRNPLFHSILLPRIVFLSFPNLVTELILLAWGLHVLLDLFTVRGRLQLHLSPKNWQMGIIGFGVAGASAIVTLLLFAGWIRFS